MTEFNYHGWNDLKKVELPTNELFRVELRLREGEGPEMRSTVYRLVGKTDWKGELFVSVVADRWKVFGTSKELHSDDIDARARLWEED